MFPRSVVVPALLAGLEARGYKSILDQMRSLGSNFIRLPCANEALDPGSAASGIPENGELVGPTPLQVCEKIIGSAGQIGLPVLLDRHRPDSTGYPVQRFLAPYLNLPTVGSTP